MNAMMWYHFKEIVWTQFLLCQEKSRVSEIEEIFSFDVSPDFESLYLLIR